MSMREAPLPEIPVRDLRAGGPPRHAEIARESALALRAACLSFLPAPARALVPLADGLARRWIARNETPYRDEIAAIADTLGVSGAHIINTSYEWGCTTRAGDDPVHGRPRLRRTLDWPFPGLGRHVEVAHQQGPAGDFWNVTWPGAVGVLTALAPGRFAVALNQAPLHRRLAGTLTRPLDQARHAVRTFRHVRAMPPSHLLRHVVETAADAETAVHRLAHAPVAKPVLYTVAGLEPGDTWLIERSLTTVRVFHSPVTVANDWQQPHPDWEPRGCSAFDRRAENFARRRTLIELDTVAGTDWVRPPVRNVRTRLAVEMDPAGGRLAVQGFEPDDSGGVTAATRLLQLTVPAPQAA